MAELITSVKLDLATKLRDPKYRRQFFDDLAQEEIAMQIRALRELRDMRQKDLAVKAGIKHQSAIARLEKAEYGAWSYRILVKLASALRARIKVILQPEEDAIAEIAAIEAESAMNGGEAKGTQTTVAKLRTRKIAVDPRKTANATAGHSTVIQQ